MKLTADTLISNRYRLIRQIGLGGFSVVWLVSDQLMGDHEFALKVYAPDRGLDDEGLQQFQQEYLLTVQLSHRNLLKPSHYDIHEGSPYLVMPYCKEGSLFRMLSKKGRLEEEEIASLLFQLGGGLSYLHEEGLVHQDIKPDNVLIGGEGKFLLTDFGISSKMRSTLRKSTNTAKAMTVAYAPPERFKGTQTSGAAGDIFSVGVMIFELTTGDVPWMGAGGVVLRPDMELPELPGGYSKRLEQLMRWCMAYDPKDRPSAEELTALAAHYKKTGSWPEIGGVKVGSSESAGRPSWRRQTEPLEPKETKEEALTGKTEKRKSNKGWIAVTAVVMIGLALVLIWWMGFVKQEPAENAIGIVLDEEGIPLAGTIIRLRRTDVQTVTDSSGIFSIEAGVGDSLEAEFLDKQRQTIAISSKDTIRIRMVQGLRSEEEAWQAAQGQNTVKAYQNYLSENPSGKYRQETEQAQRQPEAQSNSTTTDQSDQNNSESIDRWVHEADWIDAKSGNTRYHYEHYLSKYPQGPYRQEAIQAIANLESKTVTSALHATIGKLERDMVHVEGGTFRMGCTPEQGSACDGDPVHSVTLSTYKIGKYEVTQAQWKAVMGKNPSVFLECDTCPVESVSWDIVQEFLKKLNQMTGKKYRLPTEAEWEFAARGGNQSRGYKYSGSNTLGSVAWFVDNSGGKTHPVGQKSPNELGVYDMTGNVYEWCEDFHEPFYSSSAETNPRGPSSGDWRVMRGGSYRESLEYDQYFPVASRHYRVPGMHPKNLGFRVVL